MRLRSILSHSAQAIAEGALISLLVVGLIAGTAFAAKPTTSGGHKGGDGTTGGGGTVAIKDGTGSAAKPTGGGHGGGGCTAKAPLVNVDNTWAWGQKGSFGLPGQKLTFAINVINYDVGCASSTFTVTVTGPGGFTVSVPTSSISLKSSTSGYLWAYITSPSVIADGDNPVTVTVQRPGTSNNSATTTTYFKVYSSDAVAPTLFWPSPSDGAAISGSSYNFSVSSTDDHAVQSIDLYIDGTYRSTSACDDVSSTCLLYYTGAVGSGQHTATFKSHDWLGNVGVLTTTFTAA
jgi:hypothetical protein